MNRYTFEIDGVTKFRNVSPENQNKFFAKYGKYNPTLVSDEPGKSQGTSQSQNNQQQIDTESKSEDTSSGSQEIDPDDFENSKEKKSWLENRFGKNHLTDVLSDVLPGGRA